MTKRFQVGQLGDSAAFGIECHSLEEALRLPPVDGESIFVYETVENRQQWRQVAHAHNNFWIFESRYCEIEDLDKYILKLISNDQGWNSLSLYLNLAAWLQKHGKKLLPLPKEQSFVWEAGEHVNRACKRLKRRGLIKLGEKRRWYPV